jgi:hypothetical protein
MPACGENPRSLGTPGLVALRACPSRSKATEPIGQIIEMTSMQGRHFDAHVKRYDYIRACAATRKVESD